MYDPAEFGDAAVLTIAMQKILERLSEEERDILNLWLAHELPFEEIGRVIGIKYRGKPLTGSVIRYHRDRILARLKQELSPEDF